MPLDAAALRSSLRAARFTVDAVLDRIGEEGQAGLGRNCTVPADVALGEATDPLATLIRLFILQQALPEPQVRAALDLTALLAAGYVARDADGIRAVVDIRPGRTHTAGVHGDDDWRGSRAGKPGT